MRWLGKLLLVWTPGFVRARATREMSADFTALLVEALGERSDSLPALRAAAAQAGRRAAQRLKSTLALRGGFEDAELAWRLVSKFSGMKFDVKRKPNKSVFDHITCPILDAGGTGVCGNFCVPFVEGLTAQLCGSCGMELIEEAQGRRPCTKALVRRGGEDAG